MILNIYFKLFAMLALFPLANQANNYPYLKKLTKEKSIQKTFKVSKDATLKINNSYGNVDIITTDSNEIEFNILIRVSGDDTDKIEDRLNSIDINFKASNSLVTAETIIPKGKSSWWNWGCNNKLKYEINYLVKMPITNTINIDNDYGNITLDKIEGVAKLSCDYGKITTKELMAENNQISFDYSNGCYFEFINTGKISADYSSYTVGKSKNLEVNADYTKSKIEFIEDVTYNCDYGSLEVENVNNLTGNGDYLSLRLGDVYNNVSIKADYGAIKIKKMTSNAGNVDISSNYTGVSIGYAPEYHFNFDITLNYAALRNSDNFNFTKKREQSSSKYYSGSYGNLNTNNKITINSDYGSITFKTL